MKPLTWIQHSKIRLALHTLQSGEGHRLLLLHGLGQASETSVPEAIAGWTGPIHALDFTGHGASSQAPGGGYTCEILMADVDAVLTELGTCTVCGNGLGAYIALLIAGARPDHVRGAILCDGPGLAGGGPRPVGPVVGFPASSAAVPPDPFSMYELARDLRPPDYAIEFAHHALEHSSVDPAILVVAIEDPDWLRAVSEIPGVERSDLASALRVCATETGD